MPPSKKAKGATKATIEDLIKKHEGVLDYGNSDTFIYDRIAFNIPALDKMLGGGIPTKRLSIFAGASYASRCPNPKSWWYGCLD